MPTEEQEHEKRVAPIWEVLRPYLTDYYGEKCSEFCPNCECCERWRLAEQLLALDREEPKNREWW